MAAIENVFNRELSWIEFNKRVFAQALDTRVPLLERAKFLAIACTNLDEFFMVRVGGLLGLTRQKKAAPDPSGLSPARQLELISEQVHAMMTTMYKCYHEQLVPELEANGITCIHPSRFTDRQAAYAQPLFASELMPILTPIAVHDDAPMPLLANRGLHLLVRLKSVSPEGGAKHRYVIIPIHRSVSRLIMLPAEEGGHTFVLIEELTRHYIDRFFHEEEVEECISMRITRNADMSVQEDQAFDLLSEMESVLEARTRSDCVRLEIEAAVSPATSKFLQTIFGVDDLGTYSVPGPVDLSVLMNLGSLSGFDKLKYKPWPPRQNPRFIKGKSIFETIRAGNILLYHPYDSFDPVQQFVDEAADDPDVVAIKQVLYRTSKNSPIVAALARAAEKGKYVTALVELKARFDEERNIEWARELENAGVQVIYGIKGLKTHCKICIVLRKEPQGLRRYMHFGTGNYNEITARLYSDVSYLTCDEDYGIDASAFFNTITGCSQPCPYRKIEAAPHGLRNKLISLIEAETERSRQGHKARIMAKMNALVDVHIIKALYAASQAGVKIRLNVRGICCLRPGIKGLSENIRVISIVDRFLEHARIFYFLNGGDEQVFISSADWMPRNLDRRVELLIPVEDASSRQRLVQILETHLADTVNGWQLKSDGRYERLAAPGKKKPVRSQEEIYLQVCAMTEESRRQQRIMFEPLRPPGRKT